MTLQELYSMHDPNPNEVADLAKKYGLTYNKRDGLYYRYGDVVVGDDMIDSNGRFKVRFGAVKGNFICSNLPRLRSLEGSPYIVSGYFDCRGCENLKSLEYMSAKVCKGIISDWNDQITRL